MALNAPFPYTIDHEISVRNPTGVFKLKFGLSGKKYFIFKGLKISNTIENYDLSRYTANSVKFKGHWFVIFNFYADDKTLV